MARPWLVALMLISGLGLSLAWERKSNWYHCDCYWGSWLSWNDCSQSCYGYRYRERWVHWTKKSYCSHGHQDCYPGTGGDLDSLDSEWYDWEDCNTHCPYGYAAGSGRNKYCSCPRGRYGTCCTSRASCGSPPSVSHGSYSYSGSHHGDTASYSCYSDYRMVGGSSSRSCEVSWGYQHGYWSGSTPSCRFARTCRSNPCQNGAHCEDLIERYRCHCRSGWEGVNCERDVQPPLVSSCPGDVTILTSEHTENVHWRKPVFYDPHGFEVRVTANYDSSQFAFPWGDFPVNYHAYKPNNGMRASCLFTIKVRPHPCPPLSAPKRGMLVCNGWQTDLGQFCLASCLQGAFLPLGHDPATWLVCGASGRWSLGPLASQCLDRHHTEAASLLSQPRSCLDSQALDDVREEFVHRLNASHFGRVFCQDMGQLCRPSNVAILCRDH